MPPVQCGGAGYPCECERWEYGRVCEYKNSICELISKVVQLSCAVFYNKQAKLKNKRRKKSAESGARVNGELDMTKEEANPGPVLIGKTQTV